MNIEIELAGKRIRLGLRFEETKRYFEQFITNDNCEAYDIKIENADIVENPDAVPGGNLTPFTEAYLLMPKVSKFILDYSMVMIHGLSIVFSGKAWLITAHSGVGKTTQLRLWQRLFPDEFEIINGDKTLLSLHEDGFWLHPSPWTGKEKDTGTASAPLGGIIVLEQASENTVRRLSIRESVFMIYQQFLNLGDEADEVQAMGRLESKLLDKTPVWLLKNLGDEESARLMHKTLLDHEASEHESV